MPQEELLRRRDHLCRHPFQGLVINPAGFLTVCCRAQSNWETIESHHIDQIDNLHDFYNGSYFNGLRKSFEKKRWLELKECNGCSIREKNGDQWSGRLESLEYEPYQARNFDNDFQAWKRGESVPVRYLEFTTSNLCNQQCSTCCSYYSSKWKSLDSKLGRTVFDTSRLSQPALVKIEAILPDLDFMVIKGGEPFVEPNNLRILKRLSEVNQHCRVALVSNMQEIPDDWWPVLKALSYSPEGCQRIAIWASIDGIGDTYNWIRGGNFDKTESNIETFHEVTGHSVALSPCISIFNVFECASIFEHFAHHPAVSSVYYNNVSTNPRWVSISNLPDNLLQDTLDEQINRIESVKDPTTGFSVLGLRGFRKHITNEDHEEVFNFIDQMNAHRGFKIEDCVAGLSQYRKSWESGTLR